MKWSSFKYLVKQGWHSMVANRLMTLASIGVLVACLMITGVAALLSVNVTSYVDYLETLNEIVFFHIGRAVRARLVQAKRDGRQLLAIDAINLFQSGLAELCGTTVGVLAPEEVRLRRIMRRDGIERQYALLRIRAQEPDGFYTARCAHILQNGEISPEEFQIQANALLENLIKENAT